VKQTSVILVLIIIIAVVSVLGGLFYVIPETEQVVITQFGRPIGDPVTEPGLHVKMPFLQTANYFDKRFLEWDGDPNEITTKDKRYIWVDTYARWRITDPLLFFKRLTDERKAQSRLDDILGGETRTTVAKHVLIELVRSTNREFAEDEFGITEAAEQINFGRAALEKEVFDAASKRTSDLGIEILDFRFKRINYVEEVRREVYARMTSERKRIAEEYRSQGAGEAARINGERERDLKEITSEAYRRAQEIKGKADAEAADIYAQAYNRDPEFYRFLKTMEVYRTTMDKDTVLLLSTQGDFLRYLEAAR